MRADETAVIKLTKLFPSFIPSFCCFLFKEREAGTKVVDGGANQVSSFFFLSFKIVEDRTVLEPPKLLVLLPTFPGSFVPSVLVVPANPID